MSWPSYARNNAGNKWLMRGMPPWLRPSRATRPSWGPPDLRTMLLAVNPATRPTNAEVLLSIFFRKGVPVMKPQTSRPCPDCADDASVDRRTFLQGAGTLAAVAAAGTALPGFATARAFGAPVSVQTPETAVKALYDTLTDAQKKVVCFDWNYQDNRGLLRTHVSNNWQITKPTIDSDFFKPEQRELALEIFKGIFNPDWHQRLFKQLKDDTEGKAWGASQSLAIFGKPGTNQFEYVMTGRHMTIRGRQ